MIFGARAAAADAPDAVAIVAEGASLSYGDLARRALCVAAGLRARGLVRPAPRPVALTPRADIESVARILGCIEAGVPFVSLHPRLTSSEREASMRDARVSWELPELTRWPDSPDPEPTPVPDGAPLAILFTSGTSGRPKGAVLGRRAFRAAVAASRERLPLSRGDRWLLAMPPAHVGGLSVVLRCVAARATIVLGPRAQGFDAREIADCIARQRVTHVSLVPTMLRRLLALDPPLEAGALRAILLGGAPADPLLLEEARRRGLPVRSTYGLTEACSQVATAEEGDLASGVRGLSPLPGFEIRTVGGEIWLRGPALFDGYVGHDARETFAPGGWFPTGDLGRIDDSGRLHVDGRRSDLILSGGENVYPAEVEAALLEAPGVRAACVFGVPDPEWGERVAAALVLGRGLGVEIARRACRHAARRLAPFKRVRSLAVVRELPTKGIGKLDRRAVAELASDELVDADG